MATVLNSIVPERDKVVAWNRNYSGDLQAGFVIPETTPITVTGTGFGTAPVVEMFADYMSKTNGSSATLDDLDYGGSYDSGHYLTGLLPKYFTAFGKSGLSQRQGGLTVETNQMTGFIKIFSSPLTSFFAAFERCTPPDKYFSGATEVGVLPDASTDKPMWFQNGAHGNGQADVVLASYAGASGFVMTGNAINYIVYGTNSYDFNGWNSFSGWQTAGADPDTDNATIGFVITNANGTTTHGRSDVPAFLNTIPAQFDRVEFPGWAGNPTSQANSQTLFSWVYVSRHRSRIELINTSNNSSATTIRRIALPLAWSDTSITFNPSAEMRDGATHYRIVIADPVTGVESQQIIGALP
jgi:hypothetical protein